MRFVASLLAASAALVATAPAQAATYLVTGAGAGNLNTSQCNVEVTTCSRSDQQVAVTFSFYVTDNMDPAARITDRSVTYLRATGDRGVNYSSFTFNGQATGGTNLLAGGQGVGSLEFFEQFRRLERSLSLTNASFTTQLAPGANPFAAYQLQINAVPEPATWAMMIGGFGLVGGAMRRRRVADAIA